MAEKSKTSAAVPQDQAETSSLAQEGAKRMVPGSSHESEPTGFLDGLQGLLYKSW